MGIADVDADWEAWRRERWGKVLEGRAQGKTYRAIGKQLGVTGNRAAQLERQAIRKFYAQLYAAKYTQPHLPPIPTHDMYTLYRLKDFLTEIADDTQPTREHT